MTKALFVAWRGGDGNAGQWGPVGKLEHHAGGYRFRYTAGARALSGFRPFPEMPRLDDVYESDELFPLFANRLLAKSRPEYEAWLTWSGFDPKDPPDPLAILGVTEGIRQTDELEVFPCPEPDASGCFVTKFFVHGLRWVHPTALERVSSLRAGESLGVMSDWSNSHDAKAIALRTTNKRDRLLIGYVPRYLAHDLYLLFGGCGPRSVQVHVERLNVAAPMEMRLLCRINACWPDGFQPCVDDAFKALGRVSESTGAVVRA